MRIDGAAASLRWDWMPQTIVLSLTRSPVPVAEEEYGEPMGSRAIDAACIDETLVRELLSEQFPQWAHLPLRPVAPGGNDHRAFRLGDDLSVRLPSAPGYVPQVAKEQEWLPRLGPVLPLPVPVVRGIGRPSPTFPAAWSVYGWLPGEPAAVASVADRTRFAAELAAFLVALRGIDATGGPAPGAHSAFRGGPVSYWDDEMRDLLH
ncbi:phosphotransferase, partial [Streptomyces albidoflavus]